MLYGSGFVLISVLVISIGVRQSFEVEAEILNVLLRHGKMYALEIAMQQTSTRPNYHQNLENQQ